MSSEDKKSVPIEDVENLLRLFEESPWEEMHLVADGIELFFSTDPAAVPPSASSSSPVSGGGPAADTSSIAEKPAPDAAADTEGASEEHPRGMVAVRAPNLGVFYAAPSPDADPYVKIGDTVQEDTPIGLIEVMKLFTTIYAGTHGIVREIKVENAEMVEFDQVLMLVEPDHG